MARFNELAGRSSENLAFRAAGVRDRRASLEALGANVAAKMIEMGCGEKRAMAQIEREMGLRWSAGGFGNEIRGHNKLSESEVCDRCGSDDCRAPGRCSRT